MTENPKDQPTEGGQPYSGQPTPEQPPSSGQPAPPPPPPPPPPPAQAPPAQAPPYGQPQAYGQAPAPVSASDARMWALLANLGGIFFSFVAPLVVYLIYRDRDPFVRRASAQALGLDSGRMIGTGS